MNNPQPICPHCSSEYDIDKNESYYLYSTDDLEELVCNDCEKSFWLKVHVAYSFETAEDVEDL